MDNETKLGIILGAVPVLETVRIALFRNTPVQFHGRSELAQQLTEELRQLLAEIQYQRGQR